MKKVGSQEEGLLKEIMDYMREYADDVWHSSDEVYKALDERGYWNDSTAKTPEKTVNSYLNQNRGKYFDSVGSEQLGRKIHLFRLKKEHQSSIKDTLISEDLSEPTSPERMEARIYRILRDTKLARDLKNRHGYKCQICSYSINLGDRGLYSEAHHIKPLGSPHNGPDIAENIIVLCPNHHVLADYGAVKIDKKTLSFVPDHSIGDEFIAYHNEQIAKNP